MKTIRLFLFIYFLSSNVSMLYSQNYSSNVEYEGAISQLYFDRQPDPKSESMGRGLVANYDSEFGSYYNPALTSLGNGISFNLSRTYLQHKDSEYDYIGISYANKKNGGFSITKYNWAYGLTEGGNARFHNSIHTLNYSRSMEEEFYAGLNLNLVHMGYVRKYMFEEESGYDQKSSDAITMDIGVLKKFISGDVSVDTDLKIFQIGAAIYNVTGTDIANKNTSDSYETLPIIFRVGMSYNVKLSDEGENSGKPELQSFTHIEYENILNDSESAVVKVGEELTFADFLILRGGIISGGGATSYSYDNLDPTITFGVGLKAAVNRFFSKKDRMTFVLDYAGIPPSSSKNNDFYLLGLKIKYIP